MKIVTLYQPQHKDGCKIYHENKYFDNYTKANNYSVNKHGGYSASPKGIKAICDNGSYYILKSERPVYIYNSDLDIEHRKQGILDKLTPEEREILGV